MKLRSILPWFLLAALVACGTTKSSSPFMVSRSSGIVFVRQVLDGQDRLRNATVDYGTFYIAGECLQVRLATGEFTPILPAEVDIDPQRQTFAVGGKSLKMGVQYTLPFANEVGSQAGEVASAIGLPGSCSQRLLSMGLPT